MAKCDVARSKLSFLVSTRPWSGHYSHAMPLKINKQIFKCRHCSSEFTRQCGLSRHLKICSSKIIDQQNERINQLLEKQLESDTQIKQLLKSIDEYKLQVQELQQYCKNQIDENKEITKSVLKIAENQSKAPKKQINNTQFIINNYKDAPNLEFPHVNWSNETMENYVKLGAVKGLSKIITDYWVDNIPPEERSIWSIDYARNKFIIRMDNAWIVDINGSKFQEITIDKIYTLFMDYMNNCDRDTNQMMELMSFICDIKNKDMGLQALKEAGKYLIYDNEKYQH